VFQKEFHYFNSILLAGNMKRSKAIQGFGIGVRFLVQENLGDFVMATVGSHVQGSQVVIGDVIHGHVMLEEKLHTVQVIPLCGHVQWRQSILGF